MSGSVSDVAAFVFANGAIAREVLFAEASPADDLPGLSDPEREAFARVRGHLEATWIGILDSFRSSLWVAAKGHPSVRVMKSYRARPATMWKRSEVQMPLVARKAPLVTCGANLQVWGSDAAFVLRVWCWTAPTHQDAASAAAQGIPGVQWSGWSHWAPVRTPVEGDRFEALGQDAARVVVLRPPDRRRGAGGGEDRPGRVGMSGNASAEPVRRAGRSSDGRRAPSAAPLARIAR